MNIPNDAPRPNSDPVTTRRRPVLFLAVYLIGLVIAAGNAFPGSGTGVSSVIQLFMLAFALLPYGLAAAVQAFTGGIIELIEPGPIPLPINALGYGVIALSYLSCFLLPLAGSITTKQRSFILLFITFIILIIINVAGCSLVV